MEKQKNFFSPSSLLKLCDYIRHQSCQLLRLPSLSSLRIYTHCILSSGCAGETPALLVLSDQPIDLFLHAGRLQ